MSIAGLVSSPSAGMYGQRFTVIVDTFDVDRMLEHVMLAVSGPRLEHFLSTDATEYYRDDIESRFNEEGDVKSGFWPPLSEATVAIRQGLGFPGDAPINRRTDALYDWVLGPYDVHAGPDWAELEIPGTAPDPLTKKKFITAQAGDPGPNPHPNFGPTPPRPVLASSDMDLERLVILLQKFIVDEVVMNVVSAAL